MKAVKSSQVKAVGYDSSAKKMRVEFHNGGSYDYAGVTPDVHAGMLKADSVGKYLAKHVRDKFSYQKAAPHKK